MTLDLSSNLITSVNGSVRHLSQLSQLNLSNNSIQAFAEDEFAGLKHLSTLSLQHNKIKSIGQLQQLRTLKHLDVKYNDIALITTDQVPKKLEFIHFAGNPFKCNCHIFPFIRRLSASSIQTDTALCSKPVQEDNTHEKSNCPHMCSCGCTEKESGSFLFVNCSSRKLSVVPAFLRNNITEMNTDNESAVVMDQNIYPSLYIEDTVLEINLENNSLESLETAHFPSNIMNLYLSNNNLRRLPQSVFDNLQNLKQVSLSRNPWVCDCNARELKKWITSKNAIIQDISNIRCGTSDKEKQPVDGRAIWKLSDKDLCPLNTGLIASATFVGLSSLLFLCLSAKYLYRKYVFRSKVFLYSHGFTFFKENDLSYNKMFDAFISFHHKDDEVIIKELISGIEKECPSIRLCLHYRHFMPGEYIPDNITYAVENSKMTILILSKNFLQSEWCRFEFQTAEIQVLKDKRHRLVIIKLGDLPNEMDSSIKRHIESTTYLTWGEEYFWKKLFYILPKQRSTTNNISRNAEGNNGCNI